MSKVITRKKDGIAHPFALAMNATARKDAPWTGMQNEILNDEAFAAASATISAWPGYEKTPLVALAGLAAEIGVASLHYKDEGGRFGLGSFKALGGAYAVARLLQRQVEESLGQPIPMAEIISKSHAEIVSGITVCCATDGNHGRSVAWGAQTFGCRCVIFIHATVSDGRRDAIAQYGAEVRRCPGNYDESVREAQATATREGWFVVSDTSYEGYMEVPKDVMQGYELMGAEAFDQVGMTPTHIFLQTGVGGMAAAVASQAKRRWGADRPIIVLADPDRAACWLDSLMTGRPTAVEGDLDTLMAGLACGEVSALAWEILKDHGDAAMAVPDDAAVEIMRRLANPVAGDVPIVAGESAVAGIVALVAAMEDAEAKALLGLDSGSRVLVFGTEGDTDPELYRELVGADAATVRARAA
jgi:diaminopropionate ammonia-lyase